MDALDATEREMEDLRANGQLSSEKEVELMRQQLVILKKCYENLANIQDENNKLKRERDALREQLTQAGSTPIGNSYLLQFTFFKLSKYCILDDSL